MSEGDSATEICFAFKANPDLKDFRHTAVQKKMQVALGPLAYAIR
jgi:hypothetical protein